MRQHERPDRKNSPLILVFEHRVYFRDQAGEHWRVYDVILAPDEQSRERRYHVMPPDKRAVHREFVARSGERREYTFLADSLRGMPLFVHQLARQLGLAKVVPNNNSRP
jgi:hypothetical protein